MPALEKQQQNTTGNIKIKRGGAGGAGGRVGGGGVWCIGVEVFINRKGG